MKLTFEPLEEPIPPASLDDQKARKFNEWLDQSLYPDQEDAQGNPVYTIDGVLVQVGALTGVFYPNVDDTLDDDIARLIAAYGREEVLKKMQALLAEKG